MNATIMTGWTGRILSVLGNLLLAAHLDAQGVVYTNRNGANTAYCGATPGGPGALHRFSLPESTHDVISVSDPGGANMPESSASSQLFVLASNSGFTLSESGNAQRDALRPFVDFGAAAVASATDNWEIELAAPARFTFAAKWNSSSTAAGGISGGYGFGGDGIRPDPGTAPDAFGVAFSTSGVGERYGRGRLLAGRYVLGMNFRVDGGNAYPFTGAFAGGLVLELGPDAPAILRTQASPEGLVMEWSDLGAHQYTVETSNSLSGDNWAPVAGMEWPVTASSVVLPPPTTFPAFYRVKMD